MLQVVCKIKVVSMQAQRQKKTRKRYTYYLLAHLFVENIPLAMWTFIHEGKSAQPKEKLYL
jgi:hypothetical protein